jgi:hypothetical protein
MMLMTGEAPNQILEENQFKGNFEFEFNSDENEMYDSIAGNNRFQLIVQEEQEHVTKFKN